MPTSSATKTPLKIFFASGSIVRAIPSFPNRPGSQGSAAPPGVDTRAQSKKHLPAAGQGRRATRKHSGPSRASSGRGYRDTDRPLNDPKTLPAEKPAALSTLWTPSQEAK